jgi:peroxiredoxin
MKRQFYFLLGVVFMLVMSCSGSSEKNTTATNVEAKVMESNDDNTQVAVEDDRGYIVKVGDMAPDFTLKTTNGETFKLSDMRGKVVMLQFTASWCVVCRKEMPFIESDIWNKHKGNTKFCLMGVDRDEPLEKVREFIKQTGITYPMVLDPGGDVFALYADRKAGITRNVIIDEKGKIVMLTRLYNEEEFSEMCKKINELLK